ncbi:MAG: adenylate/guanylate cyclase domain-containing protein, partial [Methyloligellaceae bacterium]
LSNAIIEANGTIDKYMGDAVMALWNAPLDDKAHARNALGAALTMINRLETVNQEREREALEANKTFYRLDAGIGVNTGTCVVGNMGSELRFDYSAMGDPVNIASRLEGQTKQMGVRILAGEQTALQGSGFALLEVDLIRVVGKQLPERIYCLLGDESVGQSPSFQKLQNTQAGFLDAYRNARWDEADAALLALSSEFSEEFGLQKLFAVYAERIAALRSSQATIENWDGVFSAGQK